MVSVTPIETRVCACTVGTATPKLNSAVTATRITMVLAID
jgi:hypothetical protein